ncbi:hypothetical protein F8M41_015007 [Gigaspora margarita]|uniref:Uncharacterized protein n=1 Tax=Gigaspora margarita TaxID=4874 RepID=A0A8H4EUS7_GIGMA|nr:hypothetical protein F8M41_015007 [Gigaspora margarita]
MDTSNARNREYDYEILRIGGEVVPSQSIKNIDSPYHPEIQIWNRNLNPNIHLDVGGPVFQFLTLSTVSYFGILTGSIGNIGLATHLDDIIRLSGVFLVGVGQ